MTRSSRPRSRGHRRGYGGKRSGSRNSKRSAHQRISHDKYINKEPKTRELVDFEPKHSFADFGLHPGIVDNLASRGFKQPTRIQDESIPHILMGKDLIGLADTGSGKTASFVLPIIHKLKMQEQREQVLIVAPTRELAEQIEVEFRKFSRGLQLYSVLCVGGLNIRPQIRAIRRGVDVVIGTPGRLKDLMNQGELRLEKTTTLVLDEMDRMLDMGFLPDIKFMISKLPAKKQSLCFGATITPAISKLLKSLLHEPVTVSVRTSETGEHIAQDIIRAATKEEKMNELTNLLSQERLEKVLVFGQMKHSVQKLARQLTNLGYPAVAIHGNKSQPQRRRALSAFKNGNVDILVATDVASRGLDIPDVSHVINFDEPSTHEEYVHRIGRTGRAGKKGQAYTFVK